MKEEEVYAKGEAAGEIATPGGLRLTHKESLKKEKILSV